MRRYSFLLVACLMTIWASEVDAARILGLFHFQAKSHFVMFEALMKGLAAKGHDVTVISHFPQKTKLPNYTDLSIKGSSPQLVNNFTVEFVRNLGHLNLMEFIWIEGLKFCQVSLDQPIMQDLIKSNKKYDLIITEIFGVDCCYGYVHKFNVPVISMISSVAVPWANSRIANPDNPSYIPNYFLSYTSQMSFTERLVNTIFYTYTQLGQLYYSEWTMDTILRQHFGNNVPSLSELTKRTSLIFVNSHFSINQPRPTVPAFVEVAGLHITPPEQLPEDLERFLNESTEGVIYFSLGSLVRAETIPREKLNAFTETFKKLPQRVLWKINGSDVPGLPPNIKTATWLPQREILAHPNVRVFIAHGGLMGVQEAVYAGVPLIGIPLFSDQNQNVENLVNRGMALKLDYDEITKEKFSATLKTILENPSYRQTAKQLSQLFRDRPQSALETAIYWTEYVIRYGGAPHLRSAAVDMPVYQYLLLDVILVLLLGVGILIATTWFVIRKLLSFILRGNAQKETMEHKKKK